MNTISRIQKILLEKIISKVVNKRIRTTQETFLGK